MNQPFVSIITPVYNAGAWLEKTIRSVLGQTWKNFELILIDDGSSDESVTIICQFMAADKRIILLQQKKNKGVAAARNKGLLQAKGEYICFLDSDDLWLPHKLEHQIGYIRANGCRLLCSPYTKINQDGGIKGGTIAVPPIITYNDLLSSNYIPCLTAIGESSILKRFKFKKVGHEDYLYWLEILARGYVMHGSSEEVGLYRVRNDSISGNKIKAIQYQWAIYREHLKLSLARSIYYFLNYSIKGLYKYIL